MIQSEKEAQWKRSAVHVKHFLFICYTCKTICGVKDSEDLTSWHNSTDSVALLFTADNKNKQIFFF